MARRNQAYRNPRSQGRASPGLDHWHGGAWHARRQSTGHCQARGQPPSPAVASVSLVLSFQAVVRASRGVAGNPLDRPDQPSSSIVRSTSVPRAGGCRVSDDGPRRITLPLRLRDLASGLAGASATGRVHDRRGGAGRARLAVAPGGDGLDRPWQELDGSAMAPRVDRSTSQQRNAARGRRHALDASRVGSRRRQRVGDLRRTALRVAAQHGRSATLDRHLCQPSPDQRASLLASTAQRRWNHHAGRRGLSALGGEAHAHRRGTGRPRAAARGAFVPTGHQRDRSRLQHRPAVAARLHRIGPTPGVPELGTVPVRRCVDDARNRADLARVRIRQTDSDSLLVGQWRDFDRVESRPRNRARGVRGPARSRRRARARRARRDCPAPQHASGSRRHLLGRRQARSERCEVRRVLQARLVTGALPHVHVHVPHDGSPTAAHERGGGLPNRLRRRSGLRPPAASDGTDRANTSHPAGALPLAQAA